MSRFKEKKPAIVPFRRGEVVTLIGHAGRKVQKLKVLNDPGTLSFIVCWDHISKSEVKYARSQLQRIGR